MEDRHGNSFHGGQLFRSQKALHLIMICYWITYFYFHILVTHEDDGRKSSLNKTTRLEINIALTKSTDSAEAVALTNRRERSTERKSESTV